MSSVRVLCVLVVFWGEGSALSLEGSFSECAGLAGAWRPALVRACVGALESMVVMLQDRLIVGDQKLSSPPHKRPLLCWGPQPRTGC